MNRKATICRVLLVATVLVSMVPLVQVMLDWREMARYRLEFETGSMAAPRASDWVVWDYVDDQITAVYVFPQGPGHRAGIQEGDQFYMLEFQQFFDAEDLRGAIAGISPGQVRSYVVKRGQNLLEASVRFTRHPTFLYPRSANLWRFAIWGFTLGAFFHILGMFIAGGLAAHSRRARFEFALIGVSSLWVIGNLIRMMSVEVFGPPQIGTLYDQFFQLMTLIGLVGWVGFPAMLVHKVLSDTGLLERGRAAWLSLIYSVPVILVSIVTISTIWGHLGPISVEEMLVPILFYASCYVGSSALVAFLYTFSTDVVETRQWGRTGSAVIVVCAVAAGLAMSGLLPVLSILSETAAGWVVVSAQLLAVVPITIFSVGTLRYGKVDDILTRAFVYVLVLGLIFLTFVGGLSLAEGFLQQVGVSRIVVEGVFVVILLLVFERLARRIRLFASSFFASERHKARKVLGRFQEEVSEFLDAESLAQSAIEVAGKVFGARSGILFLRSSGATDGWAVGSYHPEPPYLTRQIFETIWPHFESYPFIWAGNPELKERSVPIEVERTLVDHGAALAVPIRVEDRVAGLMVLGLKMRRRTVYNLDDLDQLRSLSGHLALATDRLQLVDREKRLAAENAEAHLVALRAQINPHFLFNALNTILSLIEERPSEAEDVVEHLAGIFRYTLQTGSKAFVTIEDEMSLVEHYLSIEKARFGSRLSIHVELDDSLAGHPVPAFALQTLVENAIKHGVEKSRSRGLLTIQVTPGPEGSALIRVEDTGVGIPALFGRSAPSSGKEAFFGIGLSNVHERLRQLFGVDNLLFFRSSPDRGTIVEMTIPRQNSVLPETKP